MSTLAEMEKLGASLDAQIKEKIIHVLKIYPRISPSMLQCGVGSNMPSHIWKPVLDNLIDRKIVVSESISMAGVTGRQQSYTILSLNPETITEHKGVA